MNIGYQQWIELADLEEENQRGKAVREDLVADFVERKNRFERDEWKPKIIPNYSNSNLNDDLHFQNLNDRTPHPNLD